MKDERILQQKKTTAEAPSEFSGKNMSLLFTFGKTYGVGGAAVICSSTIKELIINKARAFIYTTAPAPFQILAAYFAHQFVNNNGAKRIQKLEDNCRYFALQAQNHLGLSLGPGPIFPVIIPGNFQVMEVAERLRNKGLGVTAIRSPTVPKNTERLRIVLHSHNVQEDIDVLISELKICGVGPDEISAK